MPKLITHLVKDGNSMAVRLPKTLLEMSNLHGEITLEAKRGQIVMRNSKNPRSKWGEHIARIAQQQKHMPDDKELSDWETTTADGVENGS